MTLESETGVGPLTFILILKIFSYLFMVVVVVAA